MNNVASLVLFGLGVGFVILAIVLLALVLVSI